jgi:hypothetical protein
LKAAITGVVLRGAFGLAFALASKLLSAVSAGPAMARYLAPKLTAGAALVDGVLLADLAVGADVVPFEAADGLEVPPQPGKASAAPRAATAAMDRPGLHISDPFCLFLAKTERR